jgi:hypothetical protein
LLEFGIGHCRNHLDKLLAVGFQRATLRGVRLRGQRVEVGLEEFGFVLRTRALSQTHLGAKHAASEGNSDAAPTHTFSRPHLISPMPDPLSSDPTSACQSLKVNIP